MYEVYDFENKTDFEKTKELVEKLKPAKKNIFGKEFKITGRITQVFRPNVFVIRTKYGKHIPVVMNYGVRVMSDYYNKTLVMVTDDSNNTYALDIDYDVTVVLGDMRDVTLRGETYKDIGYELISFWGIER